MLFADKKGYFFIVDAIIALSILAIGSILVFSIYSYEPVTDQGQFFSTEMVDTLSRNRIMDINSPYFDRLIKDGNITNRENTILEQVGEFYYRNQTEGCTYCMGMIRAFLDNVTNDLSKSGISYEISIENVAVYSKKTTQINESELLIPRRFIVYGLHEKDELYGPYIIEVLLWQ